MKTHLNIRSLLIISLLFNLNLSSSATIGLSEIEKARRPASLPWAIPFLMVFKNNKLNYVSKVYENSSDSKNKFVNAEMITNWTGKNTFLKYRVSLNELKLLWPSAKNDIERLIEAKQEYKIIYVGVWYEALKQQSKFIKKRNVELQLFKDYEKQHDNVKILNIDFDLNF